MWRYILLVAIFISACSGTPTANVVEDPVFGDAVFEIKEVNETVQENISGNQSASEIVNDSISETGEAKKDDEFKFDESSIIDSQNGISFSLDDFEHELKSGWGKIVRIRSSVVNEFHAPLKPKVVVRLYDEKDPKEEWFKPKAEFDFGVEELKEGQHAIADATVNIAYNDLNLTKKFELVLVDGSVKNHRALASISIDFNPIS